MQCVQLHYPLLKCGTLLHCSLLDSLLMNHLPTPNSYAHKIEKREFFAVGITPKSCSSQQQCSPILITSSSSSSVHPSTSAIIVGPSSSEVVAAPSSSSSYKSSKCAQATLTPHSHSLLIHRHQSRAFRRSRSRSFVTDNSPSLSNHKRCARKRKRANNNSPQQRAINARSTKSVNG